MVLKEADFSPPRDMARSGDLFGCHDLGGELLLDLVGRGQERYFSKCTGQHPQDSDLSPNVKSAETEKYSFKIKALLNKII